MFRFIRIYALERIGFLKRDSTTVWSSFAVRYLSNDCTNEKSFTVSYLINSCGLSEEKAISASKKVKFETSTNPDSVLTLFRDNGFPNTHIAKIIEKMPALLQSRVDKTLKPKFDFLKSKGLSGPQLAKSLSTHPYVLNSSLEKSIIPCFDFLTTFFKSDSKVVSLLTRSIQVLTNVPENKLIQNLTLLRLSRVPESNIEYVIVSHPRVLSIPVDRFNEIIERVKKMKFDPSQCLFVLGIKGLCMNKSAFEAKFDVYKRWGWSEDEIQGAFRKQPNCMVISEKKIMGTMDYLVNKMGYDPSLVAEQPSVLLFSLERRIIPRCSVVQLLTKMGLLGKNYKLYTFLNRKEDEFQKNLVAKFEKQVPHLLKVYQGKQGRML